ncbi:beta-2-microglobulin-like [Hippoglossus hippoglossus]|uniref:beta-2-microglobulin-like n=1 Tax=Hippoglossus hippoglossus TaxID=8267 RepID=UPI00148DD55E|nr:beta-2-microglobulin-like [Hippoglossus hippoglossus]XP_035003470.1 beta-2-microglobulin [Hippoglossus stenolepis]
MKFALCLAALAAVYCSVDSTYSSPKVQVYSSAKGKFGEGNTLICNVRDFHPPDITIELLQDGVAIPQSMQTDLSFKQNWQFHLMNTVPFTPLDGHKYSCRVTHVSSVKHYGWEPNM